MQEASTFFSKKEEKNAEFNENRDFALDNKREI